MSENPENKKMTLDELIEGSMPVVIKGAGFEVGAVARLNSVSKTFVESLGNAPDLTYKILEKAYVSINIMDGEKEMEVTAKNLERLPYPFIEAMMDAVGEKREQFKKKPLAELSAV